MSETPGLFEHLSYVTFGQNNIMMGDYLRITSAAGVALVKDHA